MHQNVAPRVDDDGFVRAEPVRSRNRAGGRQGALFESADHLEQSRIPGRDARFTNQQPLPRRAAADPWLLFRGLEHLKQQRQPAGCSGDKPEATLAALSDRRDTFVLTPGP